MTELVIARVPEVAEEGAELFVQDLDWLDKNHYVTVSPDEVHKWLSGEGTIASKPIMLTFDEGGTSLYSIVYPALLERGMKATIYLVTGFIDGLDGIGPFAEEEPLTWEQIREMQESGLITFGTMGRTGADLTNPEYTSEYIQNDLFVAKLRIQNVLGVACNHAAYPKGKINRQVKEAMEACGFKTCRAYNLYDDTLTYDFGTPKLEMVNSQPFMLSSYDTTYGFQGLPTPLQPPNTDLAPVLSPVAWFGNPDVWVWDEENGLFEGTGLEDEKREYLSEFPSRHLRKHDTKYLIVARINVTSVTGEVGLQILEFDSMGEVLGPPASPELWVGYGQSEGDITVYGVYTPASSSVERVSVALFIGQEGATMAVKDVHMYEAMTI